MSILNLRDYDLQYRIHRVDEPKYRPPQNSRSMRPEGPLASQLIKLCRILEDRFLDRWAYRKEVRAELTPIEMSVRDTKKQKHYRENQDFVPRRAGGSGELSEDEYYSESSYWGNCAYSMLLRNATVLERAGVLERRSGVRTRMEELLGRPLSDREIVVSGPTLTLLETELELATSLGAHGALLLDRGVVAPHLAIMVVEDGELAGQWLRRSRLTVVKEWKGPLIWDLGRAPGTLAKVVSERGW